MQYSAHQFSSPDYPTLCQKVHHFATKNISKFMLVQVASRGMLLFYKKYCKIYASTCWVKRYAILLQWENIENIRFFLLVRTWFSYIENNCSIVFNQTLHTLFLAGFFCLKPLCTALCCSSTRGQLPQASLQCTVHTSSPLLTILRTFPSVVLVWSAPTDRGETEKYSIGRKPNTHWKSSCVLFITSDFQWDTL